MKLNIKFYKHKASLGISRLVFLIFLGALLSSCEKSLEPDFPNFLLSDEAVFENAATIDAALANIYSGIRDNSPVSGSPGELNSILGLYTDELQNYRLEFQDEDAFYNHTVLPSNNTVATYWNDSYALIYTANTIIKGLQKSSLPVVEKEGSLGEALFLRAYLHFYLVSLFGDIPYIKTTDYTINVSVSRMPVEEIYKQIEEDLVQAKHLLPEMDNSGEKVRVYKAVASALLSRIYLYTHQWNKAFAESNTVIIGGTASWETDLNKVFLKESPSIIWQLKPEFEGAPSLEGETFVFETGPPTFYSLTDRFMSGFEDEDQRRLTWTREISDGTQSWFHPFKYKQGIYGETSTEYSILFRLAEQYLIRSEASLNMGNLEDAKDDIDIIRIRAGLLPTNANTAEEIMEDLQQQRRYELFTEQGSRWFDLKRTGRAQQVLAPIKIGWKATDLLLPLPQGELLLNPNLNPQNPGY